MLYNCLEWYKWVLTNLYHDRQLYNTYSTLFHRRTRASYVYNVCLAWYNVVSTPRIHSSVKFVGLPLATRATVE